MNKSTRLIIAAAVMAATVCSCGVTRGTVSDGWTLVWEDNFDRKHSFDTATWSRIDRGTSDWNRHMSHHDACYAMRKGNLVLRGILNDVAPNDTAPFITGGVCSMGKRTFSDGRLEIRARLNAAQGAWPAIWLLPENGNWPRDGEIDIMERLNGDSIAHQTVHSHYTYDLGITDNPPSHATGPIDPDAYNVYAVEMYPDSLAFFINGRHTFTYRRIETDKEGQFPFNRPFYLLIDMQLGGSWVGAVRRSDLPVEMLVDYVRFYKRRQ